MATLPGPFGSEKYFGFHCVSVIRANLIMEQTDVKFGKLAVAAIQLEEIRKLLGSGDKQDVFTAYQQLMEVIKRLEKAKDETITYSIRTRDWTSLNSGRWNRNELFNPFKKHAFKSKSQGTRLQHKKLRKRGTEEIQTEEIQTARTTRNGDCQVAARVTRRVVFEETRLQKTAVRE